MIEVIKHGKKKFTATCANCGCEFTYELSDRNGFGGVDCPDCGHYVAHQNFGNNNGIYYPPNCRKLSVTPDNGFWGVSLTNADEANVKGTLYGTQGDVYTTEKAKTDDAEDAVLYGTQMFKDQMSKTTAVPCVDDNIVRFNKVSALIDLKCDITYSGYVNKTRQGEYGRGFKDAIEFVKETIEKDINEYKQEEKEND